MAGELSPLEAQRWTRIGTLAALAMLLGYLESFVPIPIPGVKLGLANVAVLVALAHHDVTGACWVAIVKVLATGLLFGNPVTLAYSLTGTLLALALMAPLSQLPTMRLEMVSVVGALAHEAGQLLVAQLLLGTPLVWYGAPVLAIAGCATGLFCGVVAQRLAPALEGATPRRQSPHASDPSPTPATGGNQRTVALLTAFVVLVACAMHASSWKALGACLLVSVVACAVAHIPPRTLARSLVPAVPIALVAVIAQVAGMQQGTVLLRLGGIAITSGALLRSSIMVGRLASVTAASVALVGLAGRQGLARCARLLLRPLQRRGIDTAGPELALSTTLQLLPLLASALEGHVQPRDMLTRAFWQERLPQLFVDLYDEVVGDV